MESKDITLEELKIRLSSEEDIHNQQVKVLDLTKQLFGEDELCYRNTLREVLDTQRTIDKLKNDINIMSLSNNN